MLPNPQPFFTDLPDPRREARNKLHKLEDIVMITLCVVLERSIFFFYNHHDFKTYYEKGPHIAALTFGALSAC